MLYDFTDYIEKSGEKISDEEYQEFYNEILNLERNCDKYFKEFFQLENVIKIINNGNENEQEIKEMIEFLIIYYDTKKEEKGKTIIKNKEEIKEHNEKIKDIQETIKISNFEINKLTKKIRKINLRNKKENETEKKIKGLTRGEKKEFYQNIIQQNELEKEKLEKKIKQLELENYELILSFFENIG